MRWFTKYRRYKQKKLSEGKRGKRINARISFDRVIYSICSQIWLIGARAKRKALPGKGSVPLLRRLRSCLVKATDPLQPWGNYSFRAS